MNEVNREFPYVPGQQVYYVRFRLFCSLFLLLSSLLLAVPLPAEPAAPRIAYDLRLAGSSRHRFRVSITVQNLKDERLVFAIPAWTPGYYQIQNYFENIENVTAAGQDGAALSVTHSGPLTWEIAATAERPLPSSLRLTYDVNAVDEGYGFFGSVLREKERIGFINGASAFLYLVGHADQPLSLSVTLPKGWKVATALPPGTPPSPPFRRSESSATFSAKDYDELIDSPLQLGSFTYWTFDVEGVAVACALVGRHQANRKRLTQAISSILRAQARLIGSVPFSNYLLIFHIGEGGFSGGLEHRNSTVIHLADPIRDANDDVLLHVVAHELFHAWNVKRLRPVVLGPFDLTRPVRTASLWFAEGVTDYYALLSLVHAGLREQDWFLNEMGRRIAELENTPSRKRVSLSEASLKTWEGGSSGFDGLSYYLKGSLVGFYFDLRLRALSGGERGLREVLRALYAEYGLSDRGYPDEALPEMLDRVAGMPLRTEYDHYIRGLEEIAWFNLFHAAGLELLPDSLSGYRLVRQVSPSSPFASVILNGLFSSESVRPPAKEKVLPPAPAIPSLGGAP